MKNWLNCKNILCIRLDNMGDLLMSSPAIRALKETFAARITVLTSSAGKGIASFIPSIDNVITFDVPWVKLNDPSAKGDIINVVEILKEQKFDAAVVFTVFSQNPLPAVMLAYLAKIPLRLAYCRENPYDLLTHWVPDEEPYTFIKHQVQRDLDLVKSIGAITKDQRLSVSVSKLSWKGIGDKIKKCGGDIDKPWLILHPGVSEKKREYPAEKWMVAAKMITTQLQQQVFLTGAGNEKFFVDEMRDAIGKNAISLAGVLTLEEFITLIAQAPLVVSVNTSTIHIAAATHTSVIVLYALTNPQHPPWKVPGKVLLFDVPEEERSKNEVLRFVRQKYYPHGSPMVSPTEIYQTVKEFLQEDFQPGFIPEMISVPSVEA